MLEISRAKICMQVKTENQDVNADACVVAECIDTGVGVCKGVCVYVFSDNTLTGLRLPKDRIKA